MDDETRVLVAMKLFAEKYFNKGEYEKYGLAISFIREFEVSYFK